MKAKEQQSAPNTRTAAQYVKYLLERMFPNLVFDVTHEQKSAFSVNCTLENAPLTFSAIYNKDGLLVSFPTLQALDTTNPTHVNLTPPEPFYEPAAAAAAAMPTTPTAQDAMLSEEPPSPEYSGAAVDPFLGF